MKRMNVFINMMMLGTLLMLTLLLWAGPNVYAGVPASGDYLTSGTVPASGAIYIIARNDDPPPHKRADNPPPPSLGDDPPPHR
jgi:hypothetical protein